MTTEDQIGVRELQTKKTPSNPSQQRRGGRNRFSLEPPERTNCDIRLPDSRAMKKNIPFERLSLLCFVMTVLQETNTLGSVEMSSRLLQVCLVFMETLGMSAGGKVLLL